MGISTVMTSTIIFYVLLVVIGFVAGFTFTALTTLSRAAFLVDKVVSVDDIAIDGLSYNTTSYEISINYTNTGDSIIYEYLKFDVIVSYYDNGTPTVFRAPFRGSYTDSQSKASGWYIYGVYDATNNLQLYLNNSAVYWKPNTILNIRIILPSPPDSGSKVTVTIATPNGGKEYVEFTW